ncbi:MAG: hypothetical protein PUK70_09305 [Bacteroidales bacterium]|nr:hypothetical protein [Bacteroidales bacterium]MDY6002416.1 hypothetical protein [Candidatus Cryptobacteroides sp.]
MRRFNILKDSKFEKMSEQEMSSTRGGQLCVSCKKRARKVEVGIGDDNPYDQEIKIIDIEIH